MEMYCTLCGQVASSYPVTGDHTPGSWHWDGDPPANCNEWGIQNQSCSVCGEVFNEREVQGDHQWGGYVTETPAGCETPGEEVSYCSVCGEKGSSREIPPTGHDWGDWKLDVAATCNKEGLRVRYCKRCNHREEQEVPASDHQWGGYVTETPAGCETPGEEVSSCSVCGEKGSSREIPATGHDWGDWKWEVEATCNKDGLRVRYCKRCNMREEDYVQGGKHNYGPYKTYREPTCTERGLEYMTCTRCGDENYRYIDIIDHNFGEWYVVAEAQIGLTGVEQRDCTYGCGTFEQRVIPALEQEFIPTPPSISKVVINTPANGEYFVAGESIVYRITLTNNTGMALKGVALYDPLYSTPVISPDGEGSLAIAHHLAVGESISGEFSYDVTAEFALSGKVVNTAEAVYVYADDPQAMLYRAYSNTLETPVGIGDLPELHCSFGQSNAPANNEYYVPGETVRFEVEYSNPSLYPLVMGYVLAHVKDVPAVDVSGLATMTVLDAADVPAGESAFAYISYTVTEEDAARGAIYGYAAFTANLPNGTPVKAAITDFVTVPCGPGELPDDYVPPVNPDIDEDGIPNEEDPDMDGDGIPNGDDPDVDGDGIPNGEDPDVDGDGIPNGEDPDVDGDGTSNGEDPDVDGDDIPNGEDPDVDGDGVPNGEDPDVDGDGIPNGEDPDVDGDGIPNGEDPDVDGDGIPNGTDPDENGDGKPEDPFGVLTGMEVMKSVESLPMNGSFYTEGETVAYKITYTNSGENELINVAIYDAMSGLAEIASAEKLTPGESRTCFFNHTVTAADVARGYIANTAVGEYEVGGYSASVNSNTVMVDTDGKEDNAAVPPLFGDDDEANYDPSTGWTDDPAAGEDGESLFGVIDTDQLCSGETHCAITITGRDNASVGYEISFCAAHAATQASALMMKQASATPEMQMQAASYAVALWRTEVESAYQKLLTAADPTAQAVLLTEYIRFVTDLDNYEAILNALYPDQPALVAGKIADMWQDKCVALCHEMHTLAADRKDSLLSVEAASGAVANVCGCDITLEENGKKSFTQTYCPVHGFPYSMMDMLLGGKDTAETWTMVRQIWGVELTNAYSKVAVKLGDNSAAAKAGYAVMTQWMMAREASLIALYPENPELVAQLMVKLIMDRVNNLCLTGK